MFVALYKKDYKLHHLVDWDTLGMRGTCSAGFTLKATGEAGQLRVPEEIREGARTGAGTWVTA